jgi:hypothetical protein
MVYKDAKIKKDVVGGVVGHMEAIGNTYKFC